MDVTVDGKKIAIVLVNQMDLDGWHKCLGRTGVCLTVNRTERPDLFENLDCDRMIITLEDMSSLCDLLGHKTKQFRRQPKRGV